MPPVSLKQWHFEISFDLAAACGPVLESVFVKKRHTWHRKDQGSCNTTLWGNGATDEALVVASTETSNTVFSALPQLTLKRPDRLKWHHRTSGDEHWLLLLLPLEHTAKTACRFCACMRGNNSPCQQMAIVCVCLLKRESRSPMTEDFQTVAWPLLNHADQFVFSLFFFVVVKMFVNWNIDEKC